MSETKKDGASRREFLKLGVASAPAAAVMSVTAGEAVADETAPGHGLRETEHTRAYLASARF